MEIEWGESAVWDVAGTIFGRASVDIVRPEVGWRTKSVLREGRRKDLLRSQAQR
jgi:hypothetical protein